MTVPIDRPSGADEPDKSESDRPDFRSDYSHLAPNSDLVLPYLSRAAERDRIAALDDVDLDERWTSLDSPASADKDELDESDQKSAWDLQREAIEKDRAETPRRFLGSPSSPGPQEDNQPLEQALRNEDRIKPEGEPETGRFFSTVTEELGESKTWHSFPAAKREIRERVGHEPGIEIDHIVEQCQAKPERSGIPLEQINSSDNMARIPRDVHIEKSARYSRIPFGESEPLRNTLNGESWTEQFETGCDILNEAIERRREHND